MINYFNFKKLDDKYLITNDLGRYLFLTKYELLSLLKNQVDNNNELYEKVCKHFFYYTSSDQAFSEKIVPYMIDGKNYLFQPTGLHIFVVTNSCNMNCAYCQARYNTSGGNGFMNKEIAKLSVDLALSSPSNNLTFEFQGGEPLLNFEIIKYIVEYALSKKRNKQISFNIVSNLTLLTPEIINYIETYKIGVSTSLDGPANIHNTNRKYTKGKESFSIVCSGIEILKSRNIPIGAIETTTAASLSKPEEIVKTYLSLGLDAIFIRPLTPLGFANSNWDQIGYTAEEFIVFYKKCFEYILEVNASGTLFREEYATTVLTKILTGCAVNYMELRSPCGGGVGQLAYYYDGNIYTCDEGRMLGEMGDSSFQLGNVYKNNYADLMNSSRCKAVCTSSVLESLPECSSCVYSPYCGVCPVIHYALSGDIFAKQAKSFRCKIQQGIFDIIFYALQDEQKLNILKKWV